MKTERADYERRHTLLGLLSDDEVAKVSAAESGTLGDGEEYIHLGQPERGVQIVSRWKSVPASDVIARGAVSGESWDRLVAALGS